MRNFSEFGIKVEQKSFSGDKIKIDRVLNREITVEDYKIEASKFTDKGNGKCLYLQIRIGVIQHVLFTGSVTLMEMIAKVPAPAGFPFQTTIIKQDERYEFT